VCCRRPSVRYAARHGALSNSARSTEQLSFRHKWQAAITTSPLLQNVRSLQDKITHYDHFNHVQLEIHKQLHKAYFVGRSAGAAASRRSASMTASAGAAATSASPRASYSAAGRLTGLHTWCVPRPSFLCRVCSAASCVFGRGVFGGVWCFGTLQHACSRGGIRLHCSTPLCGNQQLGACAPITGAVQPQGGKVMCPRRPRLAAEAPQVQGRLHTRRLMWH
jgi:hypothetical protein